ncbi:MAG: repeat protein [Acidobacteriaceae bacterium]|nr:repeat protein [Acidobacteriaceae bacterium]
MRKARALANFPNVYVIVATVSLIAFSAPSMAETIHLKNGTSFQVERVQEKAGQVEYVMGGSTYSISKSLVQSIDRGSTSTMGIRVEVPSSSFKEPPPPGTSDTRTPDSDRLAKKRELMPVAPPKAAPVEVEEKKSALLERIVNKDDEINLEALAAIEKEANPHFSASAYFEAAMHEQQRGRESRVFLEHAVSLWPDQPVLLEWYAVALLEEGNLPAAVEKAERITQLLPESALAFRLLGQAYYYSDKNAEAVRAWKKSLELESDASLKKQLDRLQREMAAEADFNQQASAHFNLRFDGGRTTPELQQQILETLEAAHVSLSNQLNFSPPGSIPVLLYTQQAFFDITEAPTWAGALNDGKLRIPIEGVTVMHPKLEAVLKHELTHSFLTAMSNQRCPGWLHEGLAQLMEPRTNDLYGAALAQMFKDEKQIPLGALDQHFTSFNVAQARVAYAESLAVVDYLVHAYGMPDIQNMVKRMATGATPEAAVHAVTHSTYTQLEKEVAAYLNKTYSDH